MFPEQYMPTYTHYFIKLLNNKGILLRDYTQNIDGLERQAGIPDSRLVESHGTMATCSCILCKRPYKIDWFKKQIMSRIIPRCKCGGLVKPDIVFFNEPLPQKFNWMSTADMASCDLLIVIGTSLAVQPFAGGFLYVALMDRSGAQGEGERAAFLNQSRACGAFPLLPNGLLLPRRCSFGRLRLWGEEAV